MPQTHLADYNIKVRILSLKKTGTVKGCQLDFWGNKFYIIKVCRETYPFKLDEFRYIKPRIKK